jgi:hypothetical protein
MDEYKYRQTLFANRWNLEQSRSTIGQIYPNIEEIKIIFDFTYNGVTTIEKHYEKIYLKSDKDFFLIDCINSDCVQTDLDLSQEIRSMISQKETNLKGQKTCNGYQDFERFRAKNYHCLAEMKFEIGIKYKN